MARSNSAVNGTVWMLILLVCATTMAGPVEDAQRQTQRARQEVERAERAWHDAARELKAVEDRRRLAREREEVLPRLIESARVDAALQNQKIEAAEEAAGRAMEDLAKANRLAGEKKPVVADAEHRAEEAKKLVESMRSERLAAFQQTKEFVEASGAVGTARTQVSQATSKALSELAKTAKYVSAKAESETREAELKALRGQRPPGDAELAKASHAALRAKNMLDAMEAEAVFGDAGVGEARNALAAAEAALTRLSGRFEQALASERPVQDAKTRVTTEHTRLSAAKAELQKVENDRNAAERGLIRARDNASLGRAMQKRHIDEQVARSGELNRIRLEIRELDNDLDRARADEQRARRRREEAEQELRRAEREEQDARRRENARR